MRNFLPPSASLISWSTSGVAVGPFRRVFGLTDVPGFGELLELSELGLLMMWVESYSVRKMKERKKWLDSMLCLLLASVFTPRRSMGKK